MVFKVLSVKQDKNFTINFSILNRLSFCSGSLTLCPDSDPYPISSNNNTALGLSLRGGARDFPGGGGYSHALPIGVCAAQQGPDFEAPDLERGIIFERTKAPVLRVIMKKHLFDV